MSIQKVREYFKSFGIEDRIREFDVSSATVELAAVAVGVEGACIAKSMSFKIGEEPIIIVMAGDAKVDNSRYKAQFHTKAKMLTFDEAHTMIGHDPGGVCSFALPENVKSYLDISLKRFETVFPAAGSSNSAIELTCEELEKYSSNFVAWIDVIRPAIEWAQKEGINATGPYPSDIVFHKALVKKEFDGVVTMYHDQGQIALKLIGFEGGITVAGGFPIPIVTCGHGTAYDIAGKGVVTTVSFETAVKQCATMAAVAAK